MASGHNKLNYHRSKIGVITSPECVCGVREDAEHFLFECECYSRYRFELVHELNLLCGTNMASLKSFAWKTLLGQDRSLGKEKNQKLVKQVLAFVRKTRRFSSEE